MNVCSRCDAPIPEKVRFCPGCGHPTPQAEADELLATPASDPTGLLERLRNATTAEFTIVRELGRGGMGRVFLAYELALDRRVALKVLPPALAEHGEIVERFQREARTAGKLSHPHIVPVYQVSERGGLYFFTMPYVTGPDLRQVLRRTPQLEFDLCRRYLREAADALGYAHGQGVIHRDIKPENMLLEGNRDGRLLLTDFGIAKALDTASTLTRPGDLMGTPYYMSPEQCQESGSIDGRSDQYSLGMLAYEMLAGRFPYAADNLVAVVHKHLHEYPEPLEKLRPGVPDDLSRSIERAIRKDPGERFPSIAALREALEGSRGRRAVAGAAQAIGAASGRAVVRRRRLRRWATALAVTVALALAAWAVGREQLAPAGGSPARLDRLTVTGGEGEPPALAEPGRADPPLEGTTPAESRDPAAGEVAPPASDIRERDESAGDVGANLTAVQSARREADRARQAALVARADSIFPARFEEIESQLRRARLAAREGRLVVAALGFSATGRRFQALAERAQEGIEVGRGGEQAGPAGGAERGEPALDSGGAAAERPEPAPPVAPEAAIAALLDAYRAALEAEDLESLRREVYRGPLPVRDREFFQLLFRSAEGLAVTVELERLEVSGDRARGQVRQGMRYRLARTGDRRSTAVSFRAFFDRGEGLWRLVRLER